MCRKIRYPKKMIVDYHCPYQKLPFGPFGGRLHFQTQPNTHHCYGQKWKYELILYWLVPIRCRKIIATKRWGTLVTLPLYLPSFPLCIWCVGSNSAHSVQKKHRHLPSMCQSCFSSASTAAKMAAVLPVKSGWDSKKSFPVQHGWLGNLPSRFSSLLKSYNVGKTIINHPASHHKWLVWNIPSHGW